jgi:predicted metal-dependent RNase
MSIVSLRGGEARAVYSDRFRSIFEGMGVLQVQRATDVEFESATGEWVATHRESGQVIGRGRNRSEVVAQEVEWLEKRLEERREEKLEEKEIPKSCHTL